MIPLGYTKWLEGRVKHLEQENDLLRAHRAYLIDELYDLMATWSGHASIAEGMGGAAHLGVVVTRAHINDLMKLVSGVKET